MAGVVPLAPGVMVAARFVPVPLSGVALLFSARSSRWFETALSMALPPGADPRRTIPLRVATCAVQRAAPCSFEIDVSVCSAFDGLPLLDGCLRLAPEGGGTRLELQAVVGGVRPSQAREILDAVVRWVARAAEGAYPGKYGEPGREEPAHRDGSAHRGGQDAVEGGPDE